MRNIEHGLFKYLSKKIGKNGKWIYEYPKKKTAKKDYKYIDKFKVNGKWQYIYNKAQDLKTKTSGKISKTYDKVKNVKIDKPHKYLEKFMVNGKWRYIYNKVKNKKISIGSGFIKQKISDIVNRPSFSNTLKKTTNIIKKVYRYGLLGTAASTLKELGDTYIDRYRMPKPDNKPTKTIVVQQKEGVFSDLRKEDQEAINALSENKPILDSINRYLGLSENTSPEDTIKALLEDEFYAFRRDDPNETIEDFLKRTAALNEWDYKEDDVNFDNVKKLQHDMNDDEDMFYVNSNNVDTNKLNILRDKYRENPNDDDNNYNLAEFEILNSGYLNNCAYSTLAYDMRQRGYDVSANNASLDTNNTKDVIESWYKNAKTEGEVKVTNEKDISNLIKKNTTKGNASGHFLIYWATGGGHDIVYEVKNNNITLRDCQSNKSYTLKEYYKEYGESMQYVDVLRTDNKELTTVGLIGVVNNEEDKKK